jgi:hypothetical protein
LCLECALSRVIAWSVLLGATLIAVPAARASCGAGACALHTDWETQGLWSGRGLRVDLRHEHVDLDQPRRGSRRVDVGERSRHHDEVRTLNRNTVLRLDWGFSPRASAYLTVPYVEREHVHLHHHHGAVLRETWDIAERGDIEAGGRYALATRLAAPRAWSFGLDGGVRLPSGAYRERNGDGDLAERSLQPGSGSTDVVLGAWGWLGWPGTRWSAFGRLGWRESVNARANYRPGDRARVDLGVRAALDARFAFIAQLNVEHAERDRGREAEAQDSGGRAVYLTPGLSFAPDGHWLLYAFVQQPLHQHVHGVQLTARRSFAAGVSYRF